MVSLSCYHNFEYLPICDQENRVVHHNIKINDMFLNKNFESFADCNSFIRERFVKESKIKGLRCDFVENMNRLTIMKKIDNIIKNAKEKFKPYFVVYDRESYELVVLGVINEK